MKAHTREPIQMTATQLKCRVDEMCTACGLKWKCGVIRLGQLSSTDTRPPLENAFCVYFAEQKGGEDVLRNPPAFKCFS